MRKVKRERDCHKQNKSNEETEKRKTNPIRIREMRKPKREKQTQLRRILNVTIRIREMRKLKREKTNTIRIREMRTLKREKQTQLRSKTEMRKVKREKTVTIRIREMRIPQY